MGKSNSMVDQIIYDKGFSNNIIGDHDEKIKNIIKSQLKEHDAFVNTTWIEIDDDLKKILDRNPLRLICYSGPDWENTVCRSSVHSHLTDPIYIGNTYNENYFSFWLDFVYEHLQKYQTFDPYNIRDLKLFMCLNRKPHRHRVELVEKLRPYFSYGHISLGSTPPILLDTDIVNEEGSSAVVGDVGITNDITSLGHERNWNTHFLNIVTETTVHTNVFLSEKIFKPIIGRRPFVVLGDDNVYKVLHDWGFDTFDDIFGTGYNGKWYTNRIQWIADVVDSLKTESLDKLFFKIKPRLEYNYNHFFTVAKQNKNKIENLKL